MESQRVRHLFDLCLCWWVDCLCWSEFIPNISPPLLITPSPRCTPTLRCLWPASAVESMSQGRTSTRQKPCSPKKETPALLRCTPASLAVRHRYTNIPHCLINMSYPVSAVSSVISIMLTLCVCVCVCVCAAGDKKMMVPSSTAGGQQLYSQSSPFQQGHSGKSFRYVSVKCVADVMLQLTSITHFITLLLWSLTELLISLNVCAHSSSVIHVPGVNDIQPSGSSNQNLAQITRQLNPGQVAWSGNRPPFSGQVPPTHTHTQTQTNIHTHTHTQCLLHKWISCAPLVPSNRWTYLPCFLCACITVLLRGRMCWAYVS